MKKLYLLYLFMGGLLLTTGCQKEYSFENGAGPSAGTLQDDGAGDCLPKTVNGAYVVGTALNGNTNYIEVQVDVTDPGSYTIYTDTLNGMYFRASGIFSSTGLSTVRLKGKGTPVAARTDDFVVHYGSSGCSVPVTTSATLAVFDLDGAPGGCTAAAPAGVYTVNVDLTSSNTVNIGINVTTVGAYSITTAASNGMTFTSSGILTSPGPQSIVLVGSGKPATAGNTNVPITAGSSTCSFTIPVNPPAAAAVYTADCGSAAPAGTYTAGVALSGSNTVSIGVNVTTPGTYTITGTGGGMTFTHSGTFTATGTQTITLNGTGTPGTQGANTINISSGATPCSFTITVNPGAPPAVFTADCSSATPSGTYAAGTALNSTNKVTITVNVTTAGSYNISTTSTGGMVFSAAGTFTATGNQTVTLTGSGTPPNPGTFDIPMPGAASCTFPITVTGTAQVDWKFNVGTTVYQGTTVEAIELIVMGMTTLTIPGLDATSGSLSITLTNPTGGIGTGTYSGTSLTSKNAIFLYSNGTVTFTGTPGTGSNLPVNVTTYNTTSKIIQGTFSGTVKDANNANVSITNGTFKATLP